MHLLDLGYSMLDITNNLTRIFLGHFFFRFILMNFDRKFTKIKDVSRKYIFAANEVIVI